MKRRQDITYFILAIIIALSFSLVSCSNAPGDKGGKDLSIESLTPVQSQTLPGGTVVIQSSVNNPGNAQLTYKWSATGGGFGGSGANNTWQAPNQTGSYDIKLTIEDGKGGTAQSGTTITVSDNKAPAIISLSANPIHVTPGGSSIISCNANDPDGDIVHYSWNAGDGSLSGSGNKVSWISPNKTGDISITCVVSDGKGGEAKQSITVAVSPGSNNITINLTKQDSGTVSSKGDKDTTRYRSGDDDNNVTYRAFFSFDIFSLNKTNINKARIKFSPGRTTGTPFSGLTGLRLWKVNYGDGLPDFNITGDNLYYAGALLTSSPTEVDVTPEIKNLVLGGINKFQLEALFGKNTNSNNAIDYIDWPDAVLLITFNP
jgi:hypothetical protein